MRVSFSLACLIALGLSSAVAAGPDLRPKFNTSSGSVQVSNVGDAEAPVSWVTVTCAAAGGGSCPEPTAADAAPYLNPAFPNAMAMEVPALQPGAKSTKVIKFFNNLIFAPGSYSFTVCADAGADISEDSERNNCTVVRKTVRALVGG